jgi:glycosyltransferase involved in cell wall biosynthesis
LQQRNQEACARVFGKCRMALERNRMRSDSPLVSVVIPTRNRPDMVGRAVRSALQQTVAEVEVIVVVDGPDPNTEAVLKLIQASDSRLRIVSLPQNVGGADARNAGIKAAKGEWVALLDDDDEWMAHKLEEQLALAEKSSHRSPVISCKIIGRTPIADHIWPTAQPSLPIAEYLMRRRGLFQGEGGLYCPTLIARRDLFLRCPFTSGLKRHQDYDWVIRAFNVPGVGLEFVPEPLVICHLEENRAGISAHHDWRYSLDWINSIRPLINAQTYASFLLTKISASASAQGDWAAFLPLLISAVKKGRPRAIHVAIYIGLWAIPIKVRRFIRSKLLGRQRRFEKSQRYMAALSTEVQQAPNPASHLTGSDYYGPE